MQISERFSLSHSLSFFFSLHASVVCMLLSFTRSRSCLNGGGTFGISMFLFAFNVDPEGLKPELEGECSLSFEIPKFNLNSAQKSGWERPQTCLPQALKAVAFQ